MQMITATTESGVTLRLALADTIGLRYRGLLGRPSPIAGEGLLIKRCHAVHTVGMCYPIDVVYLDRDFRIVGVSHSVPKGRLRVKAPPRRDGCTQVVELGDREASRLGLATGGRLHVLADAPYTQFAQLVDLAGQAEASDFHVSVTRGRTAATHRLAAQD